MATSLTKQPSSFGLCKNPGQMVFRIASDQYITTPGSALVFLMGYTIGNNPTNGLTLIIDADVLPNPVTFTFVNTIPASNLEVFIGVDSAATNANLLAAIQLNYELVHFYEWTNPAGSIIARARANGVAYNISLAGTSTINSSTSIAAVDRVVKSDLRIKADLWISINSSFSLELEQLLSPDENGVVEIDVYDNLLGYLDASFPSFNQVVSSLASGVVLEYRLRHTDYYSGAYQAYNDTGILRTVLAGYPEKRLGTQQFASDYFSSSLTRKFLTRINRTEGLKATPDCPAYLYMWAATNATYKLGVKFTYTDGDTSTAYNILNRAATQQLICWPIGYDALNLDALVTAGKTVKHYEVFILIGDDLDTATFKTELFKVVPDTNYYEKKHFFLFQNSLGGVDTVMMTGNKELNIETSGEQYIISTPTHNEYFTFGEVKSAIKTFINPEVYFTGYKSKAYIEYLQELIKSELIYLITDSQYIEMRMNSDNVRLYTLNDFQYGLELEMTPAQINRGWAQ